jgi:hypothetical protein
MSPVAKKLKTEGSIESLESNPLTVSDQGFGDQLIFEQSIDTDRYRSETQTMPEHDQDDATQSNTQEIDTQQEIGAQVDVHYLMKAIETGIPSMTIIQQMVDKPIDTESADNVQEVLKTVQQKIADEHEKNEEDDSRLDHGLKKAEAIRLKQLEIAIKTGIFPTKGTLGNYFRRQQSKSANSAEGMTNEEAKTFRMQWATDLKNELASKKTSEKIWKRTDTTKWLLRPFGKLVQDLGGWSDKEAIAGATRGAMQCMIMGHPFVQQHPQTQMTIYAVAEIEWSESFDQSWKETVEYYTKDRVPAQILDEKATPASSIKKQTTSAVIAGTKVKEIATPTPKQTCQDQTITPPSTTDQERKAYADLWRRCLIIKSKYVESTRKAIEIIDEIKRGGKWEWAHGSRSGQLAVENDLATLRSALDPWHRDLLMSSNIANFKKNHSQSKIIVELTSFEKMEPLINKLAKTCDAIVSVTETLSAGIEIKYD